MSFLLKSLLGNIKQGEIMFLEDLDWAGEHHTRLLEKYRDQWVAIYNKKVVAYGSSIAEVKQSARAKTGQKHIPVYFVDSGSSIYAC